MDEQTIVNESPKTVDSSPSTDRPPKMPHSLTAATTQSGNTQTRSSNIDEATDFSESTSETELIGPTQQEAASSLPHRQRRSTGKRCLRDARLLVGVLSNRLKRGQKKRKRPTYAKKGVTPESGRCCQSDGEARSLREKISFWCGGSDVGSQSSRISHANSVVLACRQILGPLHDQLPPAQYISKRMDDHVQCSAEMVQLRACSSMTREWNKQQQDDWTARAKTHFTSKMLQRSAPSQNSVPEQLWQSLVLPCFDEPPPGKRPKAPDLPNDDELWQRAWKRTYESEGSESGSDEEDSPRIPIVGG